MDKLSTFKMWVAHLEDEQENMLSSMVDIKRSQQKDNDNNYEV